MRVGVNEFKSMMSEYSKVTRVLPAFAVVFDAQIDHPPTSSAGVATPTFAHPPSEFILSS